MIDVIREVALRVVGQDEPETYDGIYMHGLRDEEAIDRNKLRAEQRLALEEILKEYT